MNKLRLIDVWNTCIRVNGVNICGVMWLQNPYMIIENTETFEDAKERAFIPIQAFHTLAELNKAISKELAICEICGNRENMNICTSCLKSE